MSQSLPGSEQFNEGFHRVGLEEVGGRSTSGGRGGAEDGVDLYGILFQGDGGKILSRGEGGSDFAGAEIPPDRNVVCDT